MTFGQKLQQLRKQAGLSQEALAERLHVTRQAVSKWERNAGYPETETTLRIAKLFGVTLDELLGESPARQTPLSPPEEGLSWEEISGFLSLQRRRLALLGLSVALLIGSLAVPLWFADGNPVLFLVLVITALLLLLSIKLRGDPYRRLRQPPCPLDPTLRAQLTEQAAKEQRSLHGGAVLGAALLAVGLLVFPLLIPPSYPTLEDAFLAAGMLLAGAGGFLCIYCLGLRRTYQRLLPDPAPRK